MLLTKEGSPTTQFEIVMTSADGTQMLRREYVLIETDAIYDYDAFGTITLIDVRTEKQPTRYVLQPIQHAAYFIGRTASGLYQSNYSNALSVMDCMERLFTRLTTTEHK